jgi:hypothetical protein
VVAASGEYGQLLNNIVFTYQDSSTALFGDNLRAAAISNLNLQTEECFTTFTWYELINNPSYFGCGARLSTNFGNTLSLLGSCFTGGACWAGWINGCSEQYKSVWNSDPGKCILSINFGSNRATGINQGISTESCVDCPTCSAGTYRTNCTGTSAGICAPCANFGEGYYNSGCQGMFAGVRQPCVNCSAGSYRANCSGALAGSCTPCEIYGAGYFNFGCGGLSTGIPRRCDNCSSGMYRVNCSGLAAGFCVLCADHGAGYFNAGCGGLSAGIRRPCDNCSVGRYRVNCSGVSPGLCIECSDYGDGYYNSGCQGLSGGTRQPCGSCFVGEFRANCSGISGGSCEACTDHGEGYYNMGCGGLQAGVRQACGSCTLESYRVNCSGLSSGSCKKCTDYGDGYYNMGCGGLQAGVRQACGNCSVGSYRANCSGISKGSCTPCADYGDGYYNMGCGGMQAGVRQACDNCSVGSYRAHCSGISKGSCTPCADYGDGYYNTGCGGMQAGVRQACDNCSVGSYRANCSGISKGSCTPCADYGDGYYNMGCGGMQAGVRQSCSNFSAGQHLVDCSIFSTGMLGSCRNHSILNTISNLVINSGFSDRSYWNCHPGWGENNAETISGSLVFSFENLDAVLVSQSILLPSVSHTYRFSADVSCSWGGAFSIKALFYSTQSSLIETIGLSADCSMYFKDGEKSYHTFIFQTSVDMRGAALVNITIQGHSKLYWEGFYGPSMTNIRVEAVDHYFFMPNFASYYIEDCGGLSPGIRKQCKNCSAGMYRINCSGPAAGTCIACEEFGDGSYNSGCGGMYAGIRTTCDNCTTGAYRANCSGLSAGYCKACEDFGEGHYNWGCSGLSAGIRKRCDNCSMGTYRANCSGISPGLCSACADYGDGYYNAGCGGMSAGMRQPCGICSAGMYWSEYCSEVTSGLCVKCTDFGSGYFNWGCGNLSRGTPRICDDCSVGTYRVNCSGVSAGFCIACAGYGHGYYNSGCGGLSAGTQQPCGNCSAGMFRANCSGLSAGVCTVCDVGKYSLQSGATKCESCDLGKYASAEGLAWCNECNTSSCLPGFYRKSCSNTADSDCIECEDLAPLNAYYLEQEPWLNVHIQSIPDLVNKSYSRCRLWSCNAGFSLSTYESKLSCIPCNTTLPPNASFAIKDGISFACSWSCNSGFYLSQHGSCLEIPCATNQYKTIDGICNQCSDPRCLNWQYKSPCTATLDATCLNCSLCPNGKYPAACQPNLKLDQYCIECTNKYDPRQCDVLNSSVSVYTSSGLENDCSWKCIDKYYRSGNTCKLCTTASCGIGMHRKECTESADGMCTPCSNLPAHADFISSGIPFNADNCSWTCKDRFYLQHSGNISMCVACQQPTLCPVGHVIKNCTLTENYACIPCKSQPYANFIMQDSCDFECNSGYYKNDSICVPCTSNITCAEGQKLVACAVSYDALCTSCHPRVQYKFQIASPNGLNIICKNCSTTPCDMVGMYRGTCSPFADSSCIPCTNGPLHSYYVSSGEDNINNCSWQCNAGFAREKLNFNENSMSETSIEVCSPCKAGSYSNLGDTACTSCAAGKYSPLVGSSSSDTCKRCEAGKYSTQLFAVLETVCKSCEVGTYQGNPGSSTCTSCPKDTYGTAVGQISQDQCFACRSFDTSTRNRIGVKFETACICNENYYRVNNNSVQCQKCPPGLQCNGYNNVIPVVNGSVWEVVQIGSEDFYRLVFCPQGYFYPDLNAFDALDPNFKALFGAQQCFPCSAGTECVKSPCSVCSRCLPGKFKPCAGPDRCQQCPANTFEPANGSLACRLCGPGTTTNGLTGCVIASQCVCDSENYDLGLTPSQGCQICPAGLQCYGNSTVLPRGLDVGMSTWEINIDNNKQSKFNLTFCPNGYFLAGSISTPGQLQCTVCAPGFECVDPPCYGECTMCKPGFYKASTKSYKWPVPRSKFDQLSQSFVRNWIEEPCFSCPVNTYRMLAGGTELGSCTSCPPKSTTAGLMNRTEPSDCKCDIFFYQQTVSPSSELYCSDCPQGAVCASDRSCAFNSLGVESFHIGNIQSNLSCANPEDLVYGTWMRNISGEYRLISCPPGFTLQRSEFSVTTDKCSMCPAESYLLEVVTSPYTECKVCPFGAKCPGGSVVKALPGFWQAPISRRGSNLTATIFPCHSAAVCGEDNNCNNNRTGPVRGFIFYLCCLFLLKK